MFHFKINVIENYTGKKIRSLRLEIRKSQGSIAKMIGISTPAFSKIECGVTDINLSRLKQISQLFKVSTRTLIEEDPYEKEKKAYIQKLEDDLKLAKDEVIEAHRRLIRLLPD